MAQNLYSLGLLRNGKVYQNKQLAMQGLTQTATNDGVAKLARYLESESGTTYVKTVVGFYANASEMEDAGGGQSCYTILDIEGNAENIQELQEDVAAINNIIGDGIDDKTLTEAINSINESIGSGFTSANTIADALNELREQIIALELVAGNGISISSNTISVVAAEYSASGITNPIIVDEDGIKFSSFIDCGFFDN